MIMPPAYVNTIREEILYEKEGKGTLYGCRRQEIEIVEGKRLEIILAIKWLIEYNLFKYK